MMSAPTPRAAARALDQSAPAGTALVHTNPREMAMLEALFGLSPTQSGVPAVASAAGRGGDSSMVYATPEIEGLLSAMGGAGTVNPATGKREYRQWGANEALNRQIAEATGYGGDFGGGALQSWLNDNPGALDSYNSVVTGAGYQARGAGEVAPTYTPTSNQTLFEGAYLDAGEAADRQGLRDVGFTGQFGNDRAGNYASGLVNGLYSGAINSAMYSPMMTGGFDALTGALTNLANLFGTYQAPSQPASTGSGIDWGNLENLSGLFSGGQFGSGGMGMGGLFGSGSFGNTANSASSNPLTFRGLV